MDDDVLDCSDRKPDGKLNIDSIYNGSVTFDQADPELEHGRPVSNPSVFTFLTHIYQARKDSRQPIPIPEHITKTLEHVKCALLVNPISYAESDGRMIGTDEYTTRWSSREAQRVALGKEVVRVIPDRKGNRYKRKFYVGQTAQEQAGATDILSLSHDMEPFEAAQFVNLYPESAEEAKALIPTLDRFADKELHWYRDELKRFEINSSKRQAAADSEPAHKRMKHVSVRDMNVDRAMRDVVHAQRGSNDESGAIPTTPNSHLSDVFTPAGGITPSENPVFISVGGTPGNVLSMQQPQTPQYDPSMPNFDQSLPSIPGHFVQAQRSPFGSSQMPEVEAKLHPHIEGFNGASRDDEQFAPTAPK
eukprot:GEMP01036128.1.p1 GENE.GEMP01036128.1~~GEMP01036128.1.p1  ORF type:complete len:362 (+),score=82.72 GEMP01036128.1:91-1176(+)